MTAFLREALQDFVIEGEKSPPPVFIGRQDILGDIFSQAELSGRKGIASPGNTRIIQGAPGAGKSSILSELTAQNLHADFPKTLQVSSIEVCDEFPDVLKAIGALGASPKSKLETMAETTARALGGLAMLDVLGSASLSLNLSALFQSSDIRTIGSLHKVVPASQWDSPVIVAIDEAQNLPAGHDSVPARFLRAIHEATTKLPITLVLAGLGDTQSHIRSLGLTHGIQAHSLQGFTKEECAELMNGFCDYFGIRVGDCDRQLCALSHAADGWPRHMHWAQQAVAEAVLEPGIDGNLDRIGDWTKVQARSDVLRQGYYNSQFSDEMTFARKLVAQLMLEVGKAQIEGQILQEDEIRNRVRIFIEQDLSGNYELPDGFSPQGFVKHLIHCGALQEDPHNHGMSCPIPSFQSYIIRRGGLDPRQLSG
ncbi:MAG: ATP-binding protein [Gammaproteobacteria bacterium]|nr:ATP-binding protein [Gammaproteobacteria bacterium]